MHLTITYPTRPHRPSIHTSLVADHFGLTADTGEHVVARDLDLPIEPGTVVAFTGPSGSGKSSLLRAAVAELERDGGLVVRPDDLTLPDIAVIDALGVGFERAMALLSSCGLAEPRLMLRRPTELSDGERWRFRLALALSKGPQWVAADEFTAALDRTLAKVVAFNVRRQCDRTGVGFLIATCHEDVIEDLAPDLHVRCEHDGSIEVRGAKRKQAPGSGPPLLWGEGPGVRGCPAAPLHSCNRSLQGADEPLQRANSVQRLPSPLTPLPRERGTGTEGGRDARTYRQADACRSPRHQTTTHHSTTHHLPWPASRTNSNSRPERHATGRTSLGGITGRTGSEACGS